MFIARNRTMSSKLQRRGTDAVSIGILILISTVASARWNQSSHEIGNRLNGFPVFCLAAGHRAKAAVLIRARFIGLHQTHMIGSNCVPRNVLIGKDRYL
jgi:hypothetical protein